MSFFSIKLKPYFQGRNVLVTGAGGIVGYSICVLLVAYGAKVLPIVRSRSLPSWYPRGCIDNCLKLDLSSREAVFDVISKTRPDTVIHLAANNNNHPDGRSSGHIYADNLVATVNLLDALRFYSPMSTILMTSSHELEGNSINKFSPYQTSKLCSELVVKSYAEYFSVNAGLLRIGNVYGGADRNINRFIPSVAYALLCGRVPSLRSGLDQTRSFVLSWTVALLILGLITKLGSLSQFSFRLRGSSKPTLAEVYRLIVQAVSDLELEQPSLDKIVCVKYSISFKIADNDILYEDVPMGDGLAHTVKWYFDHPDIFG